MASTILSRTQGTPTNADKWTFSVWVKSSNPDTLNEGKIMGTYVDANNYVSLGFNSEKKMSFYAHGGGAEVGQLKTNRRIRDPGAWYHFVYVWDTAASATDRMRIYVNGEEQTSFATDTNPALNLDSLINTSGNVINIGTNNPSAASSQFFQGVMAHIHFCDGQAYAASDFGETDATSGIWVAKSGPSVTYGNNGFFLKMASGALGTDSSGNGNTMAVTGTMTNTKDTPDNNFCTINPLAFAADGFTIVNANTAISAVTDTASYTVYGTMAVNTGKWYWEAKAVNVDSTSYRHSHGIGDVEYAVQADVGEAGDQTNAWTYGNNGGYKTGGSGGQESGDYLSYETGDFLMFGLDCDNAKLYLGKNGTWQKSGVPTSGATGTGAISIVADRTYAPAFVMRYAANQVAANFGNGYFGTTSHGETNADDAGIGLFKYDVPAGYYALCTNNFGDQS